MDGIYISVQNEILCERCVCVDGSVAALLTAAFITCTSLNFPSTAA